MVGFTKPKYLGSFYFTRASAAPASWEETMPKSKRDKKSKLKSKLQNVQTL